jgi:purine-binding chemotaxis protein CheW
MTMLRGKRILLVDRDQGIRKSLTIFFRSIDDCIVSTAENGRQALQILKNEHFDFILCDLLLPDMTGKDCIARMQSLCKDTRTILMVPYGSMESRQSASELMDFLCLEKPFSGEEVAAFLAAMGPLTKKTKTAQGQNPFETYEQTSNPQGSEIPDRRNCMKEEQSMIDKEEDLFEDEDSQKDKYLTFHLAGEDYGVEIRYVTEIIGIQKITEVPDMPDFIRGVINLRGKVIPVMDVRTRFRLPSREYDERTCIIVVDINESAVGLLVDEVREVADIPEAQVEAPPATGKGSGSGYIQGMGKLDNEVKIILNVNRLLNDGELEQMEAA